MCAILDASVVGKVFHECCERRSEAGRGFIKWINSGRGGLVTGGELRGELNNSREFREWWQQAVLAGQARGLNGDKEKEVIIRTKKLIEEGVCKSNDHHVIALAQVSGVHFLYSDDVDLHEDFGNKRLIDKPRGTVYSTKETDAFTPAHKAMLRKRTCRI